MPRTTVVIPSFERPLELKTAVLSVLAQTDRDFELVIVFDGPQAESEGALGSCQSDPRLSVVTQAHAGVSAARNLGIRRARGEWIAFLDDDDLWHPTKLARQLSWTTAQGYLASQCEEIWIRRGRRVNPMQKHEKPSGWIFPHCVDLCAISPSAALLHRSVFDAIGCFDPDLPACEDYDLWLRLALYYPVGCLRESLITKFGGHASQLSARHPAMDRFRVRALEKILEDPELEKFPHWRQKALQGLRDRCKLLAHGAQKRGLAEEYADYHARYARLREARDSEDTAL